MKFVTNRYKRRFVHRNDPPDSITKVKCGAWTYKGSSSGYYYSPAEVEVIDPNDVWQFHKCKKCFPPQP